MTYTFLRELADSWILLAMFGFFVAVILWAFRPGSTSVYDAVRDIPFRNETAAKPACSNCQGKPGHKGGDHG